MSHDVEGVVGRAQVEELILAAESDHIDGGDVKFQDSVAQYVEDDVQRGISGPVTADSALQYEDRLDRYVDGETDIQVQEPYVYVDEVDDGAAYRFIVEVSVEKVHRLAEESFDRTGLGSVGVLGYFESDTLYERLAAELDER